MNVSVGRRMPCSWGRHAARAHVATQLRVKGKMCDTDVPVTDRENEGTLSWYVSFRISMYSGATSGKSGQTGKGVEAEGPVKRLLKNGENLTRNKKPTKNSKADERRDVMKLWTHASPGQA